MLHSEKKSRFVKSANLFLSYALSELQVDLKRMAAKGLDQELIDKRTDVINQMIDFYNVADDYIQELEHINKLCNISNRILEDRMLDLHKKFQKALQQLADSIPINKMNLPK